MEYVQGLTDIIKNSAVGSTVANAVGIPIKEEYDRTFRKSKTNYQHSMDVRELRYRYPDRVPIIIEPHRDITIDRKKYLTPLDITMGQFYYIIRKRIQLDESTALFFLMEDGSIPVSSQTIGEAYRWHRNNNGFLFISVMKENTFG